MTKQAQSNAIQEIKRYLRLLKKVRGRTPQGWNTPETILLKHGRPYFMGPDTFKGRRAAPKMCFMNAYHLALDDPKLTYVEGYAHVGLFIEHAWCVDLEGQVIEPTLKSPEKATTTVYPYGYYGVPFNLNYVTETIFKSGVYGIFAYNRELVEGKVTPEEFLAKAA